jgi:flagellar biogenesis protein FliO
MIELLQPALALLALGGASFLLWNLRRPGSAANSRRRLEVLDRVVLTQQHSVHLLRVEQRWMAVGVTPKGIEMLESGEYSSEPVGAPPPAELFPAWIGRQKKGSACGN